MAEGCLPLAGMRQRTFVHDQVTDAGWLDDRNFLTHLRNLIQVRTVMISPSLVVYLGDRRSCFEA